VGATGFEAVDGLESMPFHEESVTNDAERVNQAEANPANLGGCAIAVERVHQSELSPRAAMVAALTQGLADATLLGDLRAAKVAHEAIGRLLAEPDPGSPTIADLGAERAKRRG
jgi:hypothetical protein